MTSTSRHIHLGRNILTIAVLAGIATACTSPKSDGGVGTLSDRVESLSGNTVTWNRTPTARDAAHAATQAFLQKPLTAEDAVSITLLNNRALQAEFAVLGIADAAIVQASRLSNPILDAAVKAPTGRGSVNLDFGVAFELLDLMWIPARTRIAEADYRATWHKTVASVLAASANTRTAFLEFQRCMARRDLLQDSLAVAEARSTLAKALVEAGNITPGKVIKIRARQKDAERKLQIAEADYQVARTRLSGLMGLRAEFSDWKIAHPLPPVPDMLELPEGIASKSEKANLMLAAAYAQAEAIAQRYRLSTPGIFPGASEVGVAAERDDGAWEVGPSIAFPLPLFDQGEARRAEGRALLSQAEDFYSQQQTEIANRAWQLSLNATTAYQSALMLEMQTLPLAQNAHADIQRQYNAMQQDLFDLMDSKEALINIELEQIDARAAYWNAAVQLDLLLQGGEAEAARVARMTAISPPANAGEH